MVAPPQGGGRGGVSPMTTADEFTSGADAFAAFARGDEESALVAAQRAFEAGEIDAEVIDLFLTVSAARMPIDRCLETLENVLGHDDLDLASGVRAAVAWTVLEHALRHGLDDQGMRPWLTMGLQANADVGQAGWEGLDRPSLRDVVSRALEPSLVGIEVAEQLLYATEGSGLPALAVQRLEGIGQAVAMDRDLSRMAERLLHFAGAVEAAYRVEAARKRFERTHDPRERRRQSVVDLEGATVVIAGGHRMLRAHAGALIGEAGGAAREVPSRQEAVRRERDIVSVMQGASMALIVVPQIAHSTSDQVRRVGKRLGVPVGMVRSASARAILDAATDIWAKTQVSKGIA
jgi:hypothetical protein